MNALFVDLLSLPKENGSLSQRGSPVDLGRFRSRKPQAPVEPELTAIFAVAGWTVRLHRCEHSRQQVSAPVPAKGFRRHEETGAFRGDPRRSGLCELN